MVLIGLIENLQHGLLHTVDNVELKVNGTSLGSGTLFVCDVSFSWQPTNQPEAVFIQYKKLSSMFLQGKPGRFVSMKMDDPFLWEGMYEIAIDQQETTTELALVPCDIGTYFLMERMMDQSHCNRNDDDNDSIKTKWYEHVIENCFISCSPLNWLSLSSWRPYW